MDLYSMSFFLSSSLLLLFPLLFLRTKRNNHGANSRLPPGPSKLPVIGSLHHVLDPLPYRTFATLAKQYGSVMHLQLGEVSTVVISSPKAAEEILKTHDLSFANRPSLLTGKIMGYNYKTISFSSYGTHWRELRKMSILELLSTRRVRSFHSVREEEVLGLVRSIASLANAGSIINLSRKLLQLTNDVSSRVVGGKGKYQQEFLRIMDASLQSAGGFNLVDLFPTSSLVSLFTCATLKMQRLHRKLDRIFDDIIEEHRVRRQDMKGEEEDLIDVLLKVQRDDTLPFPLTDEYIKALILDMFVAGSDTSAATMEWAMSELMRKPRMMERAQREVRVAFGGKEKVTEDDIRNLIYLPLVVKETLRLHPPVPLLIPHENHQPLDVLGYRFPAKTRVLVNVWAIGRDPKVWDNAEEFNPDRFMGSTMDFRGSNMEYIPFGAGRRMCPGITFGLANIEFSLACLLYFFDWEFPLMDKMNPNHQLDMEETFMLTSHRKQELCLQAIPRIPGLTV